MRKLYEIFYSYLTPNNIDLVKIVVSVAGILFLGTIAWSWE